MRVLHPHQVAVMRPAQFATHSVADLLIGNLPFADPFVKKQEKMPEILQVSRERKSGRMDRPL